jgi:hypothetical protein
VRVKLAYLVHDLNDAAVAKRVAMLRAVGVEVSLAGFWRGEKAPDVVAGAPATPLGRTYDARLFARSLSVLGQAAAPTDVREVVAGADVVMARNLEMLALAAPARGRSRLIYECLDVHGALLGAGLRDRMLRAFERHLLESVDLLLVSSPAFLTQYFLARQDYRGETLLVENKVLEIGRESRRRSLRAAPDGPPWRIGWFGMLRCRRSLALLCELAKASDGRVEVILRGKPALNEMPEFFDVVEKTLGVSFAGAYTADDLERIYGEVHFNWTIDYFEEGLNSSWLLPNRIYEGSLHGAAPIALVGVQAAAWLAQRVAGVLLTDPGKELAPMMDAMTPQAYAALRQAVEAIPRRDLVCDREDAARLARALAAPSLAEAAG